MQALLFLHPKYTVDIIATNDLLNLGIKESIANCVNDASYLTSGNNNPIAIKVANYSNVT